MKYSQAGFRFFYHCFALFDKEIIEEYAGDYQKYKEAESVICYGYIDHEKGFTFDVCALARNVNGSIQVLEKQPAMIRNIIRADVIDDEDAIIIAQDEEYREIFADKIKAIGDNYEDNKDVLESREMSFLDDLRDLYFIDDVQVYLFKQDLDPELCWVRIEGLGDHFFIGTLLNEPQQDFDYHQDERIGFALKKTADESWMAIADMNPSRILKKEDLEDGKMLKEAISLYDKERTEDNFFEVMELIRDSYIWIPCKIENDQEEKDKDTIIARPEVLESNGAYFLPVFTAVEEMGSFEKDHDRVSQHFLKAIEIAKADENISGIVINAFSGPFVLQKDMYETIEKLKTRIIKKEGE